MEIRTNDGSVVPITNVLILLTLLVITGLLISIYFQQRTLSRQQALMALPPPAPAPVTPAVISEPIKPAAIAPTRTVTRASTRNYTEPAVSASPAAARPVAPVAPVAVPPAPAPVYSTPAYVPPALPPVAPPAYTPYPPTYPDPLDQPGRSDITIPSGTILSVRLVDTLNSQNLRVGDQFRATLDAPIYVDGIAAAEEGSTVEGRVVDVQQAGRVSGVAELRVELSRLMLNSGRAVDLLTDTHTEFGETSKKADAAKVGTGAAIGAVLGAITGGGKGAAIGAATGAGAGTAGVLLSRGRPVILEPETRLSFQLRSPVTVSGNDFDSDYSYAAPGRSNFPSDVGRQRPRLRRRQF
jgi:hypothetical protein